MIRTCLDLLAEKSFTLDRDGLFNINTTIFAPFNPFFNALDNSFAVGPMGLMYYYMRKWYCFKKLFF